MQPFLSFPARALALLAWLVLTQAAAAAGVSGPQRLQAFLDDMQTLQAEFQQTVDDGKGGQARHSSGTLAIRRPGCFRWDYREPYKQLVMADGETIWMYDPDLEQVTRQSETRALAGSPAQVLSGTRPLSESFRIVDAGQDGDLDWVDLQPRSPDSQFDHIALGLDKHGLRVLKMGDKLGQHTRIELLRRRAQSQAGRRPVPLPASTGRGRAQSIESRGGSQ